MIDDANMLIYACVGVYVLYSHVFMCEEDFLFLFFRAVLTHKAETSTWMIKEGWILKTTGVIQWGYSS